VNQLFAIFDGLGPPEIIILVLLGVLLFGGKLPEMCRSLGKLKKGLEGDLDAEEQSLVVFSLLLVIVCLLVVFCLIASSR
jgi:hypothetical protein